MLSQDPITGEVEYKPVLQVTVRPPSPTLKIDLGTEAVNCTPGHPFWVDGEGWRLAKQLSTGQRLHGLSGGVVIRNVEKPSVQDEELSKAYNLVVADFGTFFVGQEGILVHDNTDRRPTAAQVPGLAPK